MRKALIPKEHPKEKKNLEKKADPTFTLKDIEMIIDKRVGRIMKPLLELKAKVEEIFSNLETEPETSIPVENVVAEHLKPEPDVAEDEVTLSLDEIDQMDLQELQTKVREIGLHPSLYTSPSKRILRTKLYEALKLGQLVGDEPAPQEKSQRAPEHGAGKYIKMYREFSVDGFYDGACKVKCQSCEFKQNCYNTFYKTKFYEQGPWEQTWPENMPVDQFWRLKAKHKITLEQVFGTFPLPKKKS